MTVTQDELASGLASRYGISAEFCARYLAANGLADAAAGSTDDFLSSLSETQRLYLDYALSTNRRGEHVYAQHQAYLQPGQSRVLDIGCGQGGTVKALHAAGIDATGIEITPGLAEYAQLNLGTASERIICGDVLSFPVERLGHYDLILCSDVIEHVSNPDALIQVASGLLRPGGRFVLQVPNRESIQQVLADGHFRIFGMTLLSRQEGRELKRQLQGWDDPYDHMGEHLPAAHYITQMELNGLTVEIAPAATGDFGNAMSLFGEACSKLAWMLSQAGLSWFTRRELSKAFTEYGRAYLAAHGEALMSGDARSFALSYLEPVWTITGTRLKSLNSPT